MLKLRNFRSFETLRKPPNSRGVETLILLGSRLSRGIEESKVGRIWSTEKSRTSTILVLFLKSIIKDEEWNWDTSNPGVWTFEDARIRKHEHPDPGTTNIPLRWTLLTIVLFFLVKNTGDSTTINDVQNQSTDHVRVRT